MIHSVESLSAIGNILLLVNNSSEEVEYWTGDNTKTNSQRAASQQNLISL